MSYKIGFSYDIHRFDFNRPLILGGVEIDHYHGLSGHSDADCLLHAIAEAIIGALGLGDLGQHFPDTDDKYLNIDSSFFVKRAKKMMIDKGYKIVNIDTTICIEKPKISSYINQMKQSIAAMLDISVDDINIKATRGEGLGFVGAEEGVACYAVVLIENKNPKIVQL